MIDWLVSGINFKKTFVQIKSSVCEQANRCSNPLEEVQIQKMKIYSTASERTCHK